MDWAKLIDCNRLRDSRYVERLHRPIYVQDVDRILFSAPFRRLANKTQVHPLYEHDHIHHRLIHSIETGSVGRSLGLKVGDWLEEQGHIEADDKHIVSGIVQAACLAHDIGNPPFGHSGEKAIGQWFAEKIEEDGSLFNGLTEGQRAELTAFEGNAQGFRILTRLEMYRNDGGMRLAHGILGAFAKYPVTAGIQTNLASDYCGLKKYGLFESELGLFEEVAGKVGLLEERSVHGRWWRRHPLVFLVEAADDICYNILDLEDAHTSGDFTSETVLEHLDALFPASNHDLSDRTPEERIAYARARAIGTSIDACVEAFKDQYGAIMNGTFSRSLIDVSSKAAEFRAMEELANTRLFTTARKSELEVQGRNALRTVLNGVFSVYQQLSQKGWDADKLDSYHQQLIGSAYVDVRDVTDAYSAAHSLADYVSGMTDRFTLKIARMVSGN